MMKFNMSPRLIVDSSPILHNDEGYQLLFVGDLRQAYNNSKIADGRYF